MLILLIILGLLCTIAYNSNPQLRPEETFEAYKSKHPKWNRAGRLTCHNCGSTLFWMVHTRGTIFAHTCRTCATKLYYSSTDSEMNLKANMAYKPPSKALAFRPVASSTKAHKVSTARALLLFFSTILLSNFFALLCFDNTTAMMIHLLSFEFVIFAIVAQVTIVAIRYILQKHSFKQ